MIAFIWQEILRADFKRDPMKQYMLNHFYNLIDSDSPIEFTKNIDLLPQGFDKLVSPKSREKMFSLLSTQANWDENSMRCISGLLCNYRLYWSKENLLQAMTYVSKSKNLKLLQNF